MRRPRAIPLDSGTATEPAPVTPTAGEAPSAVAATNRYGADFTYTIRRLTPGASYTLRLHFLEDFYTVAGQRRMNVDVAGTRVLTDFDTFAAAGGKGIPMHRDVPVVADASGRVTARFTGDAAVAGLEIVGPTPATRLGNYLQLTGISATATGPTSVVVRWKTVPGIQQYAVLRDGKVVGRTRERAYVDATAVAGTKYRYTVAPVDTDGTLGLYSHRGVAVQMPSATPKATGAFHTEGARIIDPQGKVFVPKGVNIGTRHYLDYAGDALGHAAEAKEWGWNTVRVAVGTAWWDDDYLKALVAEYRAAGIVVVIDAHDYWSSDDPSAAANADRTNAFWQKIAPRYANDSGVWYNIANEPGYGNDDWYELNERFARTVRATGAKNIIMVDAPGWGQDLGTYGLWFTGLRYAYSPTMAPSLQAAFGDVVLGQHNYGAKYPTVDGYRSYIDAVQRQGLPLVSSEFGYTTDGSTTAGSYDLNRSAAKAVFATAPAKGVGVLVWNGNGGDRYKLKADNSAFWVGGASANLSELGADLWALTH